jgi:peroxisomal membrane protein 4
MVMLFRRGPFREKLGLVLKATKQHASNLARFAVVYKTSMLVLRLFNPVNSGKEGPYDTFFAGLLGGYTVFGRAKQGRYAPIDDMVSADANVPCSSINQQIVIYVFARVILALARLSIEPPVMTSTTPTPTLWTQRLSPAMKSRIEANAWPVFASLSWAFVMYIFRWQPESIQPSLRSSMKYMYVLVFECVRYANILIVMSIRITGIHSGISFSTILRIL